MNMFDLLYKIRHGLWVKIVTPYIGLIILITISVTVSFGIVRGHIERQDHEVDLLIATHSSLQVEYALNTLSRAAVLANSVGGDISCERLTKLLPDLWIISLTQAGQLICSSSSTVRTSSETILDQRTNDLTPVAVLQKPDHSRLLLDKKLDLGDRVLILSVPGTDIFRPSDLTVLCETIQGIGVTDSIGRAVLTENCPSSSGQDRSTVFAKSEAIVVGASNLSILLGSPIPHARFWPHFMMTTAPYLAICILIILVVAGQIDRAIRRRISQFQQIVKAHNAGTLTARIRHPENMPREFAALGIAINHMADNIGRHEMQLEAAAAEQATLLHDLHHRVKNNFQLIASLLRLHKAATPIERRDNIQFIEEHVQAMGVAYRQAYAAPESGLMSAVGIARDVITALQDTARLSPDNLKIYMIPGSVQIDLDTSIALALCLSYLMSPYLAACSQSSVSAIIHIEDQSGTLVIELVKAAIPTKTPLGLRHRLAKTYISQLGATVSEPDETHPRFVLSIPFTAKTA